MSAKVDLFRLCIKSNIHNRNRIKVHTVAICSKIREGEVFIMGGNLTTEDHRMSFLLFVLRIWLHGV